MHYPFSDLGVRGVSPDDDRAEFSIITDIPAEQETDTSQLPDLRKRIELAESDHENLHEITNLLIYTSGFLLTINLGAIYFSYNNSSAILPLLTKIFLFVAAIFLSSAVLTSVHTLHLSPRVSLDDADLADMLERVCDDKKFLTDWASRFLETAVAILLASIIIFALDRFFKSPTLLSDLENITHLSVTITRTHYLFFFSSLT